MSKVAILGCGPTGLLCAHAAELAGHDVVIYSRKEKSVIPGSQHLHGPVPGLTSQYPEGTIQFVRLGTAEGYAQKVYGEPTRETGWDHYLQVYPSWNVVAAYDVLWNRWESRVIDADITSLWMMGYLTGPEPDADLTISTIPAQAICDYPHRHQFNGTRYWIKRLPTPEADKEHEIVVYNGLLSDPWYRWSILGGLCSIEYAQYPVMQVSKKEPVIEGWKAIDNTCNCWPTVARCGRWAEWRHGVTMFKAYEKACQLVASL